ncbi:MAG: energy transducer TonB, partial [Bacteroidota bacterium]
AKTEAQQPATFPGGDAAMMDYLIHNVKYPASAKAKKITGTVFVQFTVEETGKISELKVVKGDNADLNDAAMKAVSDMPDWIPAKDNGKAVRSSYTLPIKFALN